MQSRIKAAPVRVQMAQGRQIGKAPRIAATPRLRGRRWMTKRQRWLMENPFCVCCTDEGRVTEGQEVDHVVPLWQGGADDDTNYQTLCKTHHAAKTAREAAERPRHIPG